MSSPWDWQSGAACRGMPLAAFFGPDGERGPEKKAREIRAKAACKACPVRSECLEYAVSRPEKYGTWGALTEVERERLRRRRSRARAKAA